MRQVGVEGRRGRPAIARLPAGKPGYAVLSRGWMRRGWLRRLLLCPPLLCLPLMTGCLYHTRKLQPVKPPGVVMNADATLLASILSRAYDSVQTLKRDSGPSGFGGRHPKGIGHRLHFVSRVHYFAQTGDAAGGWPVAGVAYPGFRPGERRQCLQTLHPI